MKPNRFQQMKANIETLISLSLRKDSYIYLRTRRYQKQIITYRHVGTQILPSAYLNIAGPNIWSSPVNVMDSQLSSQQIYTPNNWQIIGWWLNKPFSVTYTDTPSWMEPCPQNVPTHQLLPQVFKSGREKECPKHCRRFLVLWSCRWRYHASPPKRHSFKTSLPNGKYSPKIKQLHELSGHRSRRCPHILQEWHDTCRT